MWEQHCKDPCILHLEVSPIGLWWSISMISLYTLVEQNIYHIFATLTCQPREVDLEEPTLYVQD